MKGDGIMKCEYCKKNKPLNEYIDVSIGEDTKDLLLCDSCAEGFSLQIKNDKYFEALHDAKEMQEEEEHGKN